MKFRRFPTRNRPGACEVCGYEVKVHERPLAYDHHHGTGAFRGWLCNGCNSALGFSGDNPKILIALAEYLQTNGSLPTRPYSCPPPLVPIDFTGEFAVRQYLSSDGLLH